MAMATKSEKKSASSRARPMGMSQTVTSNVEPLSQLKARDPRKLPVQPTPAASSDHANINRVLSKTREWHERQQIQQAKNARTSSRQALEIKADKKVNLESITNDPRAPPKLKEELPRVDAKVNTYLRDLQQYSGKRKITKEEAKVLIRKGKERLKEMHHALDIAEDALHCGDDDDGPGSRPNSGVNVVSHLAVNSLDTRADEPEGCAENETAPEKEEWYHHFLQWLHDKVSAIWNALKGTEILQPVANLWAQFLEWIRSLFTAKPTGDDLERGDAQV